jgi:hypothetical protein
VKVPAPFVRTSTSSQRASPAKTLAPKSSVALKNPLLTATARLVTGPPTWVPLVSASNRLNFRSKLPLAG